MKTVKGWLKTAPGIYKDAEGRTIFKIGERSEDVNPNGRLWAAKSADGSLVCYGASTTAFRFVTMTDAARFLEREGRDAA